MNLPHRIRSYSPLDYGACASVVSACSLPLEESEALLSLLGKEGVHGFVVTSKHGILGLVLYRREIKESFFPKTQDFHKEIEVLDRVGSDDEDLWVIQGVYVDPRFRRKGLGRELLTGLYGSHSKASFLALVDADNQAGRGLLLACGFEHFGPCAEAERGNHPHLYAKKYRPFGLCREAKW